jgi:hypothetical protein
MLRERLLRDWLKEIDAVEMEARVETYDDDLSTFAAEGALALPIATAEGHVEHDGARIWYATYGYGAPVILLHGGLGHSGNGESSPGADRVRLSRHPH